MCRSPLDLQYLEITRLITVLCSVLWLKKISGSCYVASLVVTGGQTS